MIANTPAATTFGVVQTWQRKWLYILDWDAPSLFRAESPDWRNPLNRNHLPYNSFLG